MPSLVPLDEDSQTLTPRAESTETLVRDLEVQASGLIPPFIPGPSAIPSAGGPDLVVIQES